MRFCVCTHMKNDSDIVESFCRYHLLFTDHIIITDDRSDDNTAEVIQSMIDEGLPITLMQIPQNAPIMRGPDYGPSRRMHDYAFNCLGADIIAHLDVDEFLFCADGSSPRPELEAFEPDVEYWLYWRTSVYGKDPSDSTVFLPSYFEEYRDPVWEKYAKTFLTRQLVTKRGVTLTRGNHALDVPDPHFREMIRIEKHPRLFIAHYPLRSVAHTIIKIANGWHKFQYYIKPGTSWDGAGFQWKYVYDFMVIQGTLMPEQVRELSKTYAIDGGADAAQIETIRQPCGALVSAFLQTPPRLRYTNYDNKNYMKLVLSFYETLVKNLVNDSR